MGGRRVRKRGGETRLREGGGYEREKKKEKKGEIVLENRRMERSLGLEMEMEMRRDESHSGDVRTPHLFYPFFIPLPPQNWTLHQENFRPRQPSSTASSKLSIPLPPPFHLPINQSKSTNQNVSSSSPAPLPITLGLSASTLSVTLPPAVRRRSSTILLLASRAAGVVNYLVSWLVCCRGKG